MSFDNCIITETTFISFKYLKRKPPGKMFNRRRVHKAVRVTILHNFILTALFRYIFIPSISVYVYLFIILLFIRRNVFIFGGHFSERQQYIQAILSEIKRKHDENKDKNSTDLQEKDIFVHEEFEISALCKFKTLLIHGLYKPTFS